MALPASIPPEAPQDGPAAPPPPGHETVDARPPVLTALPPMPATTEPTATPATPVTDRIRRRSWPLTVAVLTIALVGTGLYAFSKTESLGAAERELADANATISDRDASLATANRLATSVQASLDTTTAALSAQKACTAALRQYSQDLDALGQVNTNRYNSITGDSPFAKAMDAKTNALVDVGEYYRLSLVDVLNGNYTRALKYVKKAVAAQKLADRASSEVSAAIDQVNDATTASDVQRGILNDQWQRAQATCGFSPSAPGTSG